MSLPGILKKTLIVFWIAYNPSYKCSQYCIRWGLVGLCAVPADVEGRSAAGSAANDDD